MRRPHKPLAGPIFVCLFPKLAWTANSNRQLNGRLQYVPVARDQRIGISCHGGSHDPFVVDVTQSQTKMPPRPGDDLMVAQQVFDFGDDSGRHVDSLEQSPLEFGQHDFARDEVMLDKDVPQQIRANSTARERADEHVCIEEYPHDTAAKTSSSVRSPRASANGRTLFRSRSKRSRDN